MYPVGKLIITGIKGTTLANEEKKFIEEEKISGVILFTRNYQDPAQLAQLINEIQVLRDEYPLFISVDHEGGRVIRFKDHFTQFPSMKKLAEKKSPKLCYEVHRIMAKELSSCGINLSFSPVCDIITNAHNEVIGDRSFGSDPEMVSQFVSSAVRGLEVNKVLSCAKHFPGHGGTESGRQGDSHFELPTIKTPLETLLKRELFPFQKAVKSRAAMVMMAHLVVEKLDEQYPCTLSSKACRLLRDELKFNKIIISDDMDMQAISKYFPQEQVAIQAINAGNDLLIYNNFENAFNAVQSLKLATKDKRIKKIDLDEKIDRIESIKEKYFTDYNPIYIPSISEHLNTSEAKLLLQELTP